MKNGLRRSAFTLDLSSLTSNARSSSPGTRPDRASSRRHFLKAASAGTLLSAFHAPEAFGMLLGGDEATGTWRLGDCSWSLDARWLAGRPELQSTRHGGSLRIELSGA